MSTLTDYYRFERLATKSKTRMDCTASTQSYPDFEEKRAAKGIKESDRYDATVEGSLVVYYVDVPDGFGGNIQRKAGKALSIKGKNLSSIFTPEPRSGLGYGDVKDTTDALLFVFKNLNTVNGVVQAGGVIEVFVARGKANDSAALYHLLSDGELDDEIEALRVQSRAKNARFLY